MRERELVKLFLYEVAGAVAAMAVTGCRSESNSQFATHTSEVKKPAEITAPVPARLMPTLTPLAELPKVIFGHGEVLAGDGMETATPPAMPRPRVVYSCSVGQFSTSSGANEEALLAADPTVLKTIEINEGGTLLFSMHGKRMFIHAVGGGTLGSMADEMARLEFPCNPERLVVVVGGNNVYWLKDDIGDDEVFRLVKKEAEYLRAVLLELKTKHDLVEILIGKWIRTMDPKKNHRVDILNKVLSETFSTGEPFRVTDSTGAVLLPDGSVNPVCFPVDNIHPAGDCLRRWLEPDMGFSSR